MGDVSLDDGTAQWLHTRERSCVSKRRSSRFSFPPLERTGVRSSLRTPLTGLLAALALGAGLLAGANPASATGANTLAVTTEPAADLAEDAKPGGQHARGHH